MPDNAPTTRSHYEKFRSELEDLPFLSKSAQSLDAMTRRFGAVHTDLAEDVLTIADKLGWDCTEVFAQYIIDYLKEQMRFEKSGDYGHSDFNKIREEILDNPEVMQDLYLPGLFLAYPTTAILFYKYEFFKRTFLPRLHGKMIGAEVGYGDGFYLWILLKHVEGLRVFGFDISAPAKEFADHLLLTAGLEPDRFDLLIGNVIDGLPIEDATLDFALLAEIIEHLPNPEDAITELSTKLKHGGLLYVATMIDCNHMDHISNFESPEVVANLITKNGFVIEDNLVYRVTDDIPDSQDRAVSIAFIARKV